MENKNTNIEATENVEKKLVYISVDKLEPHPDNPRKELGPTGSADLRSLLLRRILRLS